MQKVYTKKGDKGYSSLIDKNKVSKSDNIFEAIGTVDELNAHVGMVRSYYNTYGVNSKNYNTYGVNSKNYNTYGVNSNDTIEQIQNDLFNIGAYLAKYDNTNSTINLNVDNIENSIDTMSKELTPLKNFILPAGDQCVCSCHIARTVCRRAERAVVKVCDNSTILQYINRLSDYFFVLSRYISYKENIEETIWK